MWCFLDGHLLLQWQDNLLICSADLGVTSMQALYTLMMLQFLKMNFDNFFIFAPEVQCATCLA